MNKIVIHGGKSLHGEVSISGAKNAALPILASSILTDKEIVIKKCPDLMDTRTMLTLLEKLGVVIEKQNSDSHVLSAKNITSYEAPYDLVSQMRASILVLGPLLTRFGKARVSLPGGCSIGERPVNLHITALEKMGAKINIDHGYINAEAKKLKGERIYFDIKTVTGTMNIMMAATLAEGTTIIENAAKEPEIINLAELLIKMGAKIKNAGNDTIEINGVNNLHGAEINTISDRIECGTFLIALSLLDNTDVIIKNCNIEHVTSICDKLKSSGVNLTINKDNIRVQGYNKISPTEVVALPYPGFPTDMQAQITVLLSLAQGTSIVTDTVFEQRFLHVPELRRMGAEIDIEKNSAIIKGVEYLQGTTVMATDIRASASLILAGLVARGKTTISRIYHIDRGYEKIEEKFKALGAEINRV
jgi:UDP-N-acetylglucosamine 1-carboxyvinyltransferase